MEIKIKPYTFALPFGNEGVIRGEDELFDTLFLLEFFLKNVWKNIFKKSENKFGDSKQTAYLCGPFWKKGQKLIEIMKNKYNNKYQEKSK